MRKTVIKKELLMKFCDPDRHPSINRPWSVGDKTYSTNGHIIIRIDRHPEFEEKEDAPNATRLFEEVLPHQEWFEIPELPEPEFECCNFCGGKGYYEKIEETCEECEGKGKSDIVQKTEINGCLFQNKYLRLLK